jgi:hypothetical protein
MSYFNHAYKKTFLGKGADWEAVAAQSTISLAAGELAVVDACTYKTIATGGVTASGTDIMIVQGNYNQTDTLGGNPLHGGYSESIKSKVIKPNYITKMWVSCCVEQCCPTITLTVPANCYDCDPLDATVTGDQTGHPQIRLDIKGSEVLRALNRNAYFVADMTGCCPEGGYYTPADVVDAWKVAIERDASGMSDFVTVTTTATTITIELCPSETIFDCCSFDTRDAYSHETLDLGVSLLTAEGDPCAGGCVTYATTECPVGTPNMQPGSVFTNGLPAWITRTPGETLGEEVLREIIMDGRYRQDGGWNQGNKDSSRFREIEGGALLCAEFPVVTEARETAGRGRRASYKYFYLQHTVPRYNNPTGVFDNDQYVVAVAIPCNNTALVTKTMAVWEDIAGLATNLTKADFEYACTGSGVGSANCL